MTLNRSANSAVVSISLIASMATLALKAGANYGQELLCVKKIQRTVCSFWISTDFVVADLCLYAFRTPGGTGSVQAVYRQCTGTIEPVVIEGTYKTHLFHNNFSLRIRVQKYR